jgi:aldose 1-epimerase
MDIITLERGRTRATILPALGGRIAQIEIFDGSSWLPLLYEPPDVPPEQRDPLSWGSFVMAPWPNRIANGRFTFEGAEHHVSVNAEGHGIHGLGVSRTWTAGGTTDFSCELSLAIETDSWPWPSRLRQRIELLDDGVRQTVEISAAAGVRFPAGCGWHPWFRRDARPGHDMCIMIDADERYELSRDGTPTGRILPVDRDYDLRAYSALGDRRIDDCYRLGGQPLRIAWSEIELTLTSSESVAHAVVYTPEHAVCVEPQTCAIDAFNLGARGIAAGTAIVDDHHPLVATTEWRWRVGSAGV